VKAYLKTLVSLGILALILTLLPWRQMRDVATRMPLWVWAGAFVGFVAGHRLGVAKWRLLVNSGRSYLHVRQAIRCYAAGLFANLCLPGVAGGDLVRAVLAWKVTGRPEAVLLGGAADRIIDLASLGLLVAGGGLLARGALPGWGAQLLTVGLVLGALIAGVAVLLVLRRPLVRWPARVRRPIARGLVALRRLWRCPHLALTALAFALLIQGSFVLLNAAIGREIGIGIPLAVWFLAWPLAKLAGLLPISLGGLGVRDATLAALLVPVGVPAAHGVVASLLWSTVMIAGGLFGGLVWWLLGRRRAGQPGGAAASAESPFSILTAPRTHA